MIVTVADLINAASKITLYSVEDIQGERKTDPLVSVRQAIAYIATDLGMRPTHIGRRLSRDHSTVLNALKGARKKLAAKNRGFETLVLAIGDLAQRDAERRLNHVSHLASQYGLAA